ncbi:hypothetical protein [uncultured Gimesia sp.]|uniref:hypothetical protein n=1 Tax=uncultured Gimesia sp. TaxID=1678688 RepID=UPI0030D84EEB|tara:strand:- start:36472 stop:36789 length:318 start_codon:yes stop_codon:yes gene_type:complete
MKSLNALLLCLILICPVASGCSGEAAPQVPSSAEIVASLKANLQLVVDTGEGGSGLDILRTEFEELKTQAPDKAQAIENDFQALLNTSKSENRKSLATKIIGALQ